MHPIPSRIHNRLTTQLLHNKSTRPLTRFYQSQPTNHALAISAIHPSIHTPTCFFSSSTAAGQTFKQPFATVPPSSAATPTSSSASSPPSSGGSSGSPLNDQYLYRELELNAIRNRKQREMLEKQLQMLESTEKMDEEQFAVWQKVVTEQGARILCALLAATSMIAGYRCWLLIYRSKEEVAGLDHTINSLQNEASNAYIAEFSDETIINDVLHHYRQSAVKQRDIPLIKALAYIDQQIEHNKQQQAESQTYTHPQAQAPQQAL